MPHDSREPRKLTSIWRAIVEVGIVVFLLYSTLLMREFIHASGQGKSLLFAIKEIFTLASLAVAIISGVIGYVIWEYLRKRP